MKHTESFVLLTHYPSFVIKVNLDYILSVLPVVNRVNIYSCLLNTDAQRNLKEVWSIVSIVLIAGLYMVYENLRRKEYLTELALHGLWMLEYSLIYLNRSHFLLQLLIPLLYLRYSLREILISHHYLLPILLHPLWVFVIVNSL